MPPSPPAAAISGSGMFVTCSKHQSSISYDYFCSLKAFLIRTSDGIRGDFCRIFRTHFCIPRVHLERICEPDSEEL